LRAKKVFTETLYLDAIATIVVLLALLGIGTTALYTKLGGQGVPCPRGAGFARVREEAPGLGQ
jgi:hypothetical protein